MAGNRIVSLIQQRNVSCIAEKAYSMAFVILQACSHRYVTPMATVMQHQASLGIRGDIQPITNYLNMVHAMETQLNRMQADRIGMDENEFRTKVTTEWWSFGEDIIRQNIADRTVNVQCSKELLHSTITSKKEGWFEDTVETYSSCPLISTPLETQQKDSVFKK
jgi:ATP-dependent protease ClpP protease subunit